MSNFFPWLFSSRDLCRMAIVICGSPEPCGSMSDLTGLSRRPISRFRSPFTLLSNAAYHRNTLPGRVPDVRRLYPTVRIDASHGDLDRMESCVSLKWGAEAAYWDRFAGDNDCAISAHAPRPRTALTARASQRSGTAYSRTRHCECSATPGRWRNWKRRTERKARLSHGSQPHCAAWVMQ